MIEGGAEAMTVPPVPGADGDEGFMGAFRGSFTAALRWPQLDALWERLRARADEGWYLYAIGEPPPRTPASGDQVRRFIDELDHLLRQEHDEDYCGIVYADNLEWPRFIKIYDPNNLGVSCGFSANPPLPGWLITRLPPCDLQAALLPTRRRDWWRRLFNS